LGESIADSLSDLGSDGHGSVAGGHGHESSVDSDEDDAASNGGNGDNGNGDGDNGGNGGSGNGNGSEDGYGISEEDLAKKIESTVDFFLGKLPSRAQELISALITRRAELGDIVSHIREGLQNAL
jgi:hypothetical protein